MITSGMIAENEKGPSTLMSTGLQGLQVSDGLLDYDTLAARRGGDTTGGRGVAFATFARVAVRALAEKQRSRARSTRSSIEAAGSRITSETSEMIRNLARSSIRFSRNERLFDFARKVRLLSTSATS